MYNEENADVYAFMASLRVYKSTGTQRNWDIYSSFKELSCLWGGTICIENN